MDEHRGHLEKIFFWADEIRKVSKHGLFLLRPKKVLRHLRIKERIKKQKDRERVFTGNTE